MREYEHTDLLGALRTSVETMAALAVELCDEETARDEAQATLAMLGNHLSDRPWLVDRLTQLSMDLVWQRGSK
jgi:glutathione S-transferase